MSRPADRALVRRRLLQGASVVAVAAALGVSQAQAQSAAALRGAGGVRAAPGAPAGAPPVAPPRPATPGANSAMQTAAARALAHQARAAAGVTMAEQAQQAARASAASRPGVPNGLGRGGLLPAAVPVRADGSIELTGGSSGQIVVSRDANGNPVLFTGTPASSDASGLATWQGAKGPVQTTEGGQTKVVVEQTESRAVLSWDSFNVGEATTLKFEQSQNGQARTDWVALNRVVGGLDPATGLRSSATAPAPSQILGKVEAQGTVLVLNQNGILFGGKSQINTRAFGATSLEVGRAVDLGVRPLTIADRNRDFLNFGLLGYADQAPVTAQPSAFTFSAQAISNLAFDPLREGDITVEAGAQITAGENGFILLAGPRITNGGMLIADDGQVSLQSGRQITLRRSEGRVDSVNPNVRGFVATSLSRTDAAGDYVLNTADALIRAERGYISLGATQGGAAINEGVLQSSTSVSRNGYVVLSGGDVRVGPASTLTITADDESGTIPQDPASTAGFKSSRIDIGDAGSRIEIGRDAMIYAPSATVTIGAAPGQSTIVDRTGLGGSRIFVDEGVVIDVAGLKDVQIDASRNQILIRPVKRNELRDTPDYREGFLNGVGVLVDPRVSGVREDGVAYVGSPLIEAESYAQQVGVTASERMTTGGDVTFGVASYGGSTPANTVPDIIIKSGATIDVSGGWVTYEAGVIQTTKLVTATGQVVDIGSADPNQQYIGVYGGYANVQERFGIRESFGNPLLLGPRFQESYTEGRDAGSLTLKASAAALDGTVFGDAFPGARQRLEANPGTALSGLYLDRRPMQAAASQLPVGAFLHVQALGRDVGGVITGGGDVRIVADEDKIPLSSDLEYGQSVQIDDDGALVIRDRPRASRLPESRRETLLFSADELSAMNLGQLSIETTGGLTLDEDAELVLTPGGVVDVLTGRSILIDGEISAAGGDIRLRTAEFETGSVFEGRAPRLGDFDITINGRLSTRGRFVNDFGRAAQDALGSAYLDGGSIRLSVAPRVSRFLEVASVADTLAGQAPRVNEDISGSILLNTGALLDVSGGAYVASDGALDLSSRGGDVALVNETTYFQLANDETLNAGGVEGFRITTLTTPEGVAFVPVNPDEINARVSIADGTILAHGFSGGGEFTLATPRLQFGDEPVGEGTALPLDFFSKTGFGAYDITSYATALIRNRFDNGLGGFHALLETQRLQIGAGETLSLVQSGFSPFVNADQTNALLSMANGADLYDVFTPAVPAEAFDRRGIELSLGGSIELHVQQGGRVEGAAGAGLTAGKLWNEGTIRLPGGYVRQSQILPVLYEQVDAIAVRTLRDAFSIAPGGVISEGGANALGRLTPGPRPRLLTNAELVSNTPFYLLGDLDQGEGIRLSAGSVTDLSGTVLFDPRAVAAGRTIVTGRIVDGGVLESVAGGGQAGPLFEAQSGASVYAGVNPAGLRTVRSLEAERGAVIDLSGVSAAFERPLLSGGFAAAPVWSDAGALRLANGGTIGGASIDAQGGAPQALGGTLLFRDLTLTRRDQRDPISGQVSADQIERSGFDTLVAVGRLASVGDVDLTLDRAFFLTSPDLATLAGQDLNDATVRDLLAPTVSSGGDLSIAAPFIAFLSALQTVSSPALGEAADNRVTFNARAIDVRGAVVFDRSVGRATLNAEQDLRLIGVRPFEQVFGLPGNTPNSLAGRLAVNGDLTITAGQVYPTTGTSFAITSSALDGRITFARADGPTPSTPYSAGGSLLVQADTIVQGGVIRAPLGGLTLGSNLAAAAPRGRFAPATTAVTLLEGGVTSVSADGLSIPYGTTTDQIEYFFEPASADPLTAPPTGVLQLAGGAVNVREGATVDVSGGGDVYAYEFIPGVGGSRDILDRFNPDPFSGSDGFQFPDQRQVYAVVPGLSDQAVAALDPIYSADYGDLYDAGGAGRRVYLNAAPGLPAGWYTLLPAKYALLPGGFRVVEDTGAGATPEGAVTRRPDGTLVVAGRYGEVGGAEQSEVRTFLVQDQAFIRKSSNIALTSANTKFAADAARDGLAAPRLPIDAGRLVLNPGLSLRVDAPLVTDPGPGGRGALTDIAGVNLAIVSTPRQRAPEGAIVLTADALTNLGASSLLIGGVRTEQADGTTLIDVTAQSILVDNDEDNPLTAPEVVLAVDGAGSSIQVTDGSVIVAAGTPDERRGDFVIDGAGRETGQGAVLRVAEGAERLVRRTGLDNVTAGSLIVGEATLSGDSVLLDATGDLRIRPKADITADRLALGSSAISFADRAGDRPGLVITPTLKALFGRAERLTLRSAQAISFEGSAYDFGDLVLDTPGLALDGGRTVAVTADSLTLTNSGSDLGGCLLAGPEGCGSGVLSLSADEVVFAGGTLRTYGFGDRIELRAASGLFYEGRGGFDAGSASLSIETPLIADRATDAEVGEKTILPSLELATTSKLRIDGTGLTPVGDVPGIPGAKLVVRADELVVRNARLRATAGLLDLQASGELAVGVGGVLEAPGYARVFGDRDDPYSVSAPGGEVRLTSLEDDVILRGGSTVDVGGGQGRAGKLALSALNGEAVLNGALLTKAPDSGASLDLATGGALDLNELIGSTGALFTGDIAIRSGRDDLSLGGGRIWRAESIQLAADAGLVTVAGTIDTSGVSGGDIRLFGRDGVELLAGSRLDAHADGYAAADSRQARGGDVVLGTDDDGAITVAADAVIDVGARLNGDRLVAIDRNGTTFYDYVRGDLGGTVTLRAPVLVQAGADDVNVSFEGSIFGARDISLEAFRRWDLGQVADSGLYAGVDRTDTGGVRLDTSAAIEGRPNFLAARGEGTLVEFIQDFDVSAAFADLGGLASRPEFHARPGVELVHDGDVTLASNWNFGAGEVDVPAAVAAGLMREVPGRPGVFAVLPGKEGEIFARFTTLTYRTGGRVDGETGVLALRAGGDLAIQGSLTDGFFNFRDQTDPAYLTTALGGGNRVLNPYLRTGCLLGVCDGVGAFRPGRAFDNYVNISFPGQFELPAALDNPAPYSAAANTAAAAGGDAVGGAQLFPLLESGPVESWSYRLVAGADVAGGDLRPSVDPLGLSGVDADLVVTGERAYTYSGGRESTSRFGGDLLLQAGGRLFDPAAWIQAFLSQAPQLDPAAVTVIDFDSAPEGVRSFLIERAETFQDGRARRFELIEVDGRVTGVRTRIELAADFLNEVAADFSEVTQFYRAPTSRPTSGVVTGYAETLIRTGTGDIELAASGDVDLRNGEAPRNRGGQQVGGVAVYTAGHTADLSPRMATDAEGVVRVVDPTAFLNRADIFELSPRPEYRYGAGASPEQPGVGFASILLANPVHAEGGGDVTVVAGADVLGRRDLFTETRLANSPGDYNSFVGEGYQPWRVGQVGQATDLRINPQLFGDGLGTLGGGDIRVQAGADLVDLTVAAVTSAATADTVSDLGPTRALMTFGGGDVSVDVGGDLRGGRFDLASGRGDIRVAGDVVSAGRVGSGAAAFENQLRLRLTNAQIAVQARGAMNLQGVAALGVFQEQTRIQENLNARGFFTPIAGVSLLANGSVTVANRGPDVIAPADRISGFTSVAVYPGSFDAFALAGDLNLTTAPASFGVAANVVLQPSPVGQLRLGAAGDLAPLSIAMEDADAGLLPGYFSDFSADVSLGVIAGRPFSFPAVLPTTPDVVREQLHDSEILHRNDPEPVRIYAGGDINGLILSSPKQTRVSAGRDMVNAIILAQNLDGDDVTRITAGRDITATTQLVRPILGLTPTETLGDPLAAVQGNTFVIGGPGTFYLEAGRDLGPFLNSATVDGFAAVDSSLQDPQLPPNRAAYAATYGGGVLSVGNEWNPFLGEQGADVTVMFGVANGVDYSGFRDAYLDPAGFDALDPDLFEQVEDALGVPQPDRSRPIYAPKLIAWVRANAESELRAALDLAPDAPLPTISYDQAYAVFKDLPALRQRPFLLKEVYFNEIVQSSVPGSPSFGQPSRGYRAVDTLFPVELGYTDNFPLRTLDGEADAGRRNFGPEGYLRDKDPDLLAEIVATSANVDERFARVNAAVDAIYREETGRSLFAETGNLDLRLATIQTSRGGDVSILGPGGRVLAGSTVRTSLQAARRSYDGGRLFNGGQSGLSNRPLAAAVTSIPVAFEGLLTLRGGDISSFTDGDLLLNQSRLFALQGGNVAAFSANGDLNAGQGPRTAASVPPAVVQVSSDLFAELDQTGGVSGAGIGAFGDEDATVFLVAERGTVDAGDAGVRVTGNLFIAAAAVANADAITVSGTSIGVPVAATADAGAAASSSAAAAAAQQAAEEQGQAREQSEQRSVITVNVLGYAEDCPEDDEECRAR